MYRVEETPRDELKLEEDELLVPCAHFQKEIFSTFGVPFLLRVKDVSYSSSPDVPMSVTMCDLAVTWRSDAGQAVILR